MFILNDGGSSATDPTIEQLVTGLITGDPYRLTGDYRNIYGSYGSLGRDTFAIDNIALVHLADEGFAPVPLPGVLLLLGAGRLVLGATRRR